MKTIVALKIKEIESGNYHVFVKLKIGKRNANLLLDTGASKTVFDTKKVLNFTDKKNLKKHSAQSVGLGATGVKTKIGELKNVKTGKLKLPRFEVAVLDLSHVNQTYKQLKITEIDGVLGSDFLFENKAVISYKKAELKLFH